MRDYYCLVKQLRGLVSSHGSDLSVIKPSLLNQLVGRNFGGHATLSKFALETFQQCCFASEPTEQPVPSRILIQKNLADKSARHLMILTANGSALPILFGSGLITEREATVLIGSEFKVGSL